MVFGLWPISWVVVAAAFTLMFVGFGAANVVEPLTELVRLGLINGGYE